MNKQELADTIIHRTGVSTNHNSFNLYLDPFIYSPVIGGANIGILFMTGMNEKAWDDNIIACTYSKYNIDVISSIGVEEVKALFIDMAFPLNEPHKECHNMSIVANKIRFGLRNV